MSKEVDRMVDMILREDDRRKELQARNEPYTQISAKEQGYIDEIRELRDKNKQLSQAVELAEYRIQRR